MARTSAHGSRFASSWLGLVPDVLGEAVGAARARGAPVARGRPRRGAAVVGWEGLVVASAMAEGWGRVGVARRFGLVPSWW